MILGALTIGALTIGALTIGALTIGALTIGALTISKFYPLIFPALKFTWQRRIKAARNGGGGGLLDNDSNLCHTLLMTGN